MPLVTRSPHAAAFSMMIVSLGLLAACSSSGSATPITTTIAPTTTPPPTTTIAPTTTTEAATTEAATTTEPATTTTLSLDKTIASHWQGAQLDVIGGGAPTPGGNTVMYFLKGDWGAEVYWKTKNEWCALSTFNWKVTRATSPQAFSLDFREIHHFDACLAVPGDSHLVWMPTSTRTAAGRTVYDGTYTFPVRYDASRTMCSSNWADPAPCGFPAAAAALPTPPTT